MSDPENHTIRLLQEMRADMNRQFGDINRQFSAMNERFDHVDERLARIDGRLGGLESTFAGLSFITADTRAEIENLKTRVDALEAERV